MLETKSELWRALKDAGWEAPVNKPYVSWTVAEMQEELATLVASKMIDDSMKEEDELQGQEFDWDAPPPLVEPDEKPSIEDSELAARVAALAALAASTQPGGPVVTQAARRPEDMSPQERWPHLPVTDESETIAGLHVQTHGRDDPIRIDSRGRVWYQDEVRKPANPKPRARRVLDYKETGVKTIETRNQLNLLEESFEVAGDEIRDMKVKITLPSWQVGIYKDPRLPFRVHVYNSVRGFDRLDVVEYYGGMDNVPSTIKPVYVGSSLCYDINSTRDTIEREYRERVLRIGRY